MRNQKTRKGPRGSQKKVKWQPRVCVTGKRAFPSDHAAWEWIKETKSKPSEAEITVVRAYICWHCNQYHTTSQR